MKNIILSLSTLGIMSMSAFAATDFVSTYEHYADIGAPNTTSIPKVVEVELPPFGSIGGSVSVQDLSSDLFVSRYQNFEVISKKVTITSNYPKLSDRSADTTEQFNYVSGKINTAVITLTSSEPVAASSIFIDYDSYVDLPNTVEVIALVNGLPQVVVANRPLSERAFAFLRTVSKEWKITLTYSQPLRIKDVVLDHEPVIVGDKTTVRFLAQPGVSYRLYGGEGISPQISAHTDDFSRVKNTEIIKLPLVTFTTNPKYTPVDSDKDGLPDYLDNCSFIANSDQKDENHNNVGDVCDDFDYDGIINSKDSCPVVSNADQHDTDGDGIGDACDTIESRITEKLPWLPWVGMGSAMLVLIVLVGLTFTRKPTM